MPVRLVRLVLTLLAFLGVAGCQPGDSGRGPLTKSHAEAGLLKWPRQNRLKSATLEDKGNGLFAGVAVDDQGREFTAEVKREPGMVRWKIEWKGPNGHATESGNFTRD
jgi:hypothetical protein